MIEQLFTSVAAMMDMGPGVNVLILALVVALVAIGTGSERNG